MMLCFGDGRYGGGLGVLGFWVHLICFFSHVDSDIARCGAFVEEDGAGSVGVYGQGGD